MLPSAATTLNPSSFRARVTTLPFTDVPVDGLVISTVGPVTVDLVASAGSSSPSTPQAEPATARLARRHATRTDRGLIRFMPSLSWWSDRIGSLEGRALNGTVGNTVNR